MNEISLSVIICSRSQHISSELEANFKSTIGEHYELIIIDNTKNKYSIFEAYNLGLDRSSGSIVCFVHEDVLFHTNNWGSILVHLFKEDQSLGIIGIAGSQIKTKSPSGWWNCHQDYRSANLIQHLNNDEKEHWNYGFGNKNEVEAVVIDGVFMALRKEKSIRFNESLSGFHNYDLSICIDYRGAGYKIRVTNQILIEHFSLGKIDQGWYNSAINFEKVYKEYLPVNIEDISSTTIDRLEYANRFLFIKGLLSKQLLNDAISQWLKLIKLKPLSKKNIYILKNFFR